MSSDLGGDPPCWAHMLFGEEPPARADDDGVIIDLGAVSVRGNGVVWSLPHGGDLDANLVRLEPGARIGEHVNDEVDVLIFVQAGTGRLLLGGAELALGPDHLALIPARVRRAVTAGTDGITYLSIHRRRGPLGIGSPSGGASTPRGT